MLDVLNQYSVPNEYTNSDHRIVYDNCSICGSKYELEMFLISPDAPGEIFCEKCYPQGSLTSSEELEPTQWDSIYLKTH